MTAAYAEAFSDDVAAPLRAAFLRAVWRQGNNLSDATDVRRVVAEVMNPAVVAVARRLPCTPLIPLGIDQQSGMRRSGGTITRLGGPISAAGHRRMANWSQGWEALGRPQLPAVATTSGQALAGEAGLTHLLQLLSAARSVVPQPRAAACPSESSRPSLLVDAL